MILLLNGKYQMGWGIQTTCHRNKDCKLRIIHPASPYFNKELEIERFLTVKGQKKVILKISICERISVPLAWTNFYYNPEEKENSHLFNLKDLLELYEHTVNFNSSIYQQIGDNNYDKKQERYNSKRTGDIVRCPKKQELDKNDSSTEGRDRGNIGGDPDRTGKRSGVLS